MTTRRLTAEDAELWRSIRLEALLSEPEQFSARHSDWVDRPLADFAGQIAAHPVWAVIVDGRAEAVASLTPDNDGRNCGWIEGVFVRPEARGQGHARALLSLAEAEAQACGLTELRLEVRAANLAARSLYSRLGFSEAAVTRTSCGNRCEIGMVRKL